MKKHIQKLQKHHKNAMSWMKKDSNAVHVIIGVLLTITIGILGSNFIPQSDIAKENIRQAEVLEIMIEIDNMAHKYDKILHDIRDEYNEDRDRMFHIADNAYHKAQYRDEKYKAAIELNKLVVQQNKLVYDLIDENPFSEEIKKEFEDLQKKFKKLEQK